MRRFMVCWIALSILFVSRGVVAQSPGSSETSAGDEAPAASQEGDQKNWALSGTITTRVGQGTFVDLENETNTPGEYKPVSSAYDRVNMLFTFNPTYTLGDFTFGAEFQLVQYLTPGGGIYGTPGSGGANDPADTYFQDVSLSASWKGYTFESIGVNLAPSLSLGLPTSKVSRLATQLFNVGASLSISKTFFDRLTFSGVLSGSRYFYRYKTPAIDPKTVGADNVLYRSGEAEDLSGGLVALGGRNYPWVLVAGGSSQIKILEKLSGSISYAMITYYFFPGKQQPDQYTSEYAKPGKNFGQAISTSANLSYKATDWMSVSGGIGTYMSPKTSDNKSFRFPFWNFQGAAANRSWLQLSVSGTY